MNVDDIDEDETDWNSTDLAQPAPPRTEAKVISNVLQLASPRVILHFDMDCFYAQVEMIRNPALRNVPLGIQQKYIIVTCNYVARDHGVTKLMSVTDALEKCPQLVMVKGEDLTHYRETSYKVTELLTSYCPLVERLGFDENFMDITELVEKKLTQGNEATEFSFKGHVYNHSNLDANARHHSRLAVGSHIAAELREDIHSKLGLTCCAGVATNKLLAKLVSGTFKPNQQTTLLPESIRDIMGRLSGLRKVPGVGHQTAKRLQALGLVSVQDLQLFPLAELVQEFGSSTAQRLQNLALGIDEAPVTPTGAPQSLSDEDSFKKISSVKDVLQKVEDLLGSLLERMYKDGRQPLTFRLTIRKYSATNKWFSRESRQCPIPSHTGQKITSGSRDAIAQLISIALKLFHKMVDTSAAFHLTLINVCFSNLQPRGAASTKAAINSFFTPRSPGKTQPSYLHQEDLSQCESCPYQQRGGSGMGDGGGVVSSDQGASHWLPETLLPNRKSQLWGGSVPRRDSLITVQPQPVKSQTGRTQGNEKVNIPKSKPSFRLPPNIDPEVFSLLPEDIQKELLSPAYPDPPRPPPSHSALSATASAGDGTQSSLTKRSPFSDSIYPLATCKFAESYNTITDRKESVGDFKLPDTQTCGDLTVLPDQKAPRGDFSAEQEKTGHQVSTDSIFPKDVDPRVFSELPADVQRDLRSEWKQQKVLGKITPNSKQERKTSLAKERKPQAKGSQTNNLLKYFKPS
ncbi:DNA polymerase iota isoform X1 [Osmerus mordax]|uniref:DNA polymerase iota isoform X1 n=1 Tax=Osmerus mordax TaxID=8014 RepID=UPI003510A6DC